MGNITEFGVFAQYSGSVSSEVPSIKLVYDGNVSARASCKKLTTTLSAVVFLANNPEIDKKPEIDDSIRRIF